MTGQQLKNSILQMAVQGKLVPQDPNDEPASVLLERIRAEKEKLIKEGKIKKEKNPSVIFRGADNLPYEKIGKNEPVCIADEVPFEIPESWEWCRVGDLFSNMTGLSYKKEQLLTKSDNMVRVLRGGNIDNESYNLKNDDVFISAEYVKSALLLKKNYMITPAVSSLEHIGKIALVECDYENVVVGGFVLMLVPHLSNDVLSKYLLYAFATKTHRDNCRNITHKSGQAFYNISREKLMNLPVPLPPLSEQNRIVKKIEELLPDIKKYNELDQISEALNSSFPEQLKKSILQYAVQGKLVSQDPTDEPASVLLEHIRAEKEQLIKSGKIKRDKHESVILRRDNSYYERVDGIERCIDDEIPFEIPDSWEVVRLQNIGEYRKGPFGSSLTKSMFVPKGKSSIKVYEQKNAIQKDCTLGTYYIPIEYYNEKMKGFTVLSNDIIVSCAGTIGETYILPSSAEIGIINQALMRMRITSQINVDYFLIYFDYVIKETARESSKGSAIKNIPPFDIFKKIILPLPPLKEQKRIVQEVQTIQSLISSL